MRVVTARILAKENGILFRRESTLIRACVVARLSVTREASHSTRSLAPPEFPPKPTGSLPILATPPGGYRNNQSYTYIRQSNAIMSFLDELCEESSHGVSPVQGLDERHQSAQSGA